MRDYGKIVLTDLRRTGHYDIRHRVKHHARRSSTGRDNVGPVLCYYNILCGRDFFSAGFVWTARRKNICALFRYAYNTTGRRISCRGYTMIDKRGRHRGERLPAVRLQKFGTRCSRQPHYADKISDRTILLCDTDLYIIHTPRSYGFAGTAGETLERSSCPGGGGRTGCRTGYQDLVALRSSRLRRGIIIIIVGTFHRDDKPPHSKNDSASVYSSISFRVYNIEYTTQSSGSV